MTSRPAFLDVRQSARQRRWIEKLTPAQANIALDMAQTHGIEEIIARVMAARGVTAGEAAGFLDPTIKALMPDPSVITGLNEAAERIARAVTDGERVAIFGDYDVDGAASSALLSRYLAHFGIAADIYIPDRIFEGYGPNPAAMAKLAENADLIVTVDCGTNSAAAFETVSGTDIVVLDHHQVGGPLPDVVSVVNPNRDDDMSGLTYLCAAGVVFMTLVDVSRQLRSAGRRDLPDLMALLDLVALATVCDVVPLVGLNRAFVVKGLAVARRQTNAGLAALASVARIGEPLAPFHFGFVLGPRINAGGRIGDAALGARLLTADDQDGARALAGELDALNAQRQAIEVQMVEEARAEAERELQSANPPSVIVTASHDWHPGIAGLIASRLKEALRKPAFAIAFDANGIGTGSGRSIAGFDMGRMVRAAVEAGILEKGGGHAMAAGLTVRTEKLGELRAFFEDKASEAVGRLIENDALEIDGALSASGVTAALIDKLARAGPFGAGHPEPVFALPRHQIAHVKPVGNGHLKLGLRGMGPGTLDAIAFRVRDEPLGKMLAENAGRSLHLAGTVSINHWNGRQIPQLRVIDAAIPDR
ncbi:single-stranded-DNA-specific exonuclease RecJ [Oceaniradius stylonematis]|uniref:Single-stranded-DNA-specific exonuclease RecJ n=1 Tax=Oceaniradius stylonematis TaxID=2184161 RepID=A0A3A8ARE5_9HYPH|nr:single-stranded-DNA-specific exonuclease RecJ [Oceaniradius stylonematis]RKF08131.1 single-stranded-DNA-specific exonuclease RecJ [Oceaniradius stylonematis]